MQDEISNEVEHLRRELRDVRYVAEAILMKLVGRDNALMWEMEARVQSGIRRQNHGTPLREVGISGRTLDRLTSAHWDGLNIETVEELVTRWPREEIAAMEGIGRKTMEKIDAALADRPKFLECWTREEVA